MRLVLTATRRLLGRCRVFWTARDSWSVSRCSWSDKRRNTNWKDVSGAMVAARQTGCEPCEKKWTTTAWNHQRGAEHLPATSQTAYWAVSVANPKSRGNPFTGTRLTTMLSKKVKKQKAMKTSFMSDLGLLR
jgi:hypothetical protein